MEKQAPFKLVQAGKKHQVSALGSFSENQRTKVLFNSKVLWFVLRSYAPKVRLKNLQSSSSFH